METLETKHRRHAEEYARTIPLAGFDALCAIGGDGTFNEVVNGMLTREDRQRILLGFVAGGTGNSTMVDDDDAFYLFLQPKVRVRAQVRSGYLQRGGAGHGRDRGQIRER